MTFSNRSFDRKQDRKVQQLCRQVQRALMYVLPGDIADPMLQEVMVESVRPAPDATRLLVLPGSMGTESFHVAGRGSADALNSSSHGAGRSMSRSKARDRVRSADVHRQMSGVWFDADATGSLREEAPCAYKNIRAVLRAQSDLTRVVRRLRPLLVYKGT